MKEIKQLQKENDKIREKVNDFLKKEFQNNSSWELINELIENEIKQESFCNE